MLIELRFRIRKKRLTSFRRNHSTSEPALHNSAGDEFGCEGIASMQNVKIICRSAKEFSKIDLKFHPLDLDFLPGDKDDSDLIQGGMQLH